MKIQFNLTDSRYDLERFASRRDLEKLLEGFDGIELMHLEEPDAADEAGGQGRAGKAEGAGEQDRTGKADGADEQGSAGKADGDVNPGGACNSGCIGKADSAANPGSAGNSGNIGNSDGTGNPDSADNPNSTANPGVVANPDSTGNPDSAAARQIISRDMVVGYHMTFPEYWLDFYKGNLERCIGEFDTLENLEKHYGGTTPDALINRIRKEYEFAVAMGAEYAVIHVSDAGIFEELSGRYSHTDAEVIDAFSEMLNEALPSCASDGSPRVLMENLWQPGLTFTDPQMTARLMESVRYPGKGIMLDTGHLMHTAPGLRTQKEAVQYINKRLDEHGALCSYIKGMHLHQSLTGSVMRRYMKNPPVPAKTYEERLNQLFEYIFRVDLHRPFTGQGVEELINRIGPEYLTFEFISENPEQHRNMLRRQKLALKRMFPV